MTVFLALVSLLRMNWVRMHTLPTLAKNSNAAIYQLCELHNLYETKYSHLLNKPENFSLLIFLIQLKYQSLNGSLSEGSPQRDGK